MIAEKLGKGWLSLDFIDWISSKDKDIINKFVIPDYIIDSLLFFFPSSIYSKNTYNQIIDRYCSLMNINKEDITDKFINHIKGCLDE